MFPFDINENIRGIPNKSTERPLIKLQFWSSCSFAKLCTCNSHSWQMSCMKEYKATETLQYYIKCCSEFLWGSATTTYNISSLKKIFFFFFSLLYLQLWCNLLATYFLPYLNAQVPVTNYLYCPIPLYILGYKKCFLNDLYQYLDQSEFGISSSSSFRFRSSRLGLVGKFSS